MSHPKRPLLFYRNYRVYAGGHLKVWDYFNHARHSEVYQPYIHFSPETVWDTSNPWRELHAEALPSWTSIKPDALFLAGLDWEILPAEKRHRSAVPVINLIQGLRHAQPGDPRYPFLRYRAIRICVSQEVNDALADSGQVNGPLLTITNGIDPARLPRRIDYSDRPNNILIVALKHPELGQQLQTRLTSAGLEARLLAAPMPREDFLRQLAQSKITVFLPHPQEGFYLPALEGMAMGTLVICPDCIGNRSFCLPGYNCWRPVYTLDSLLEAIHDALQLTEEKRQQLLQHARAMVAQHELARERQAFLQILHNLEQLW